jgi:hypothetical protein
MGWRTTKENSNEFKKRVVMEETIEVRVERYKRFILSDALIQCTAKQLEFFRSIYPRGVSVHDLNSAIKLCERTVRNNKESGDDCDG